MATAGSPGDGDGVPLPRFMSRPESVRFWEDLFDKYPEDAEELFFAALLRDARHERAPRARGGEEEEEEQRRRARVFRPWVPPAPGSAPPALVAATPPVKRAVVLGLRAPPHLVARTHAKTPSAPEPKDPRAV